MDVQKSRRLMFRSEKVSGIFTMKAISVCSDLASSHRTFGLPAVPTSQPRGGPLISVKK